MMNNSNKFATILPIIQWHEGMMLGPQHFQQLEIRNHQILITQLQLLSSCHWGVRHLKVDTTTLTQGLVRVLEVSGVMVDGMILSYSSDMTQIPPLEVDLSAMRTDFPKEGVMILLCLPKRIPGISPITGEYPRFKPIAWTPAKDENTDDNPIEINRLFPCLFLHAGAQPPPNTFSFPLLTVNFVDECFVMGDFTPPCFFIERGMMLWERCAQVVQKMREKVGFLTERWQTQAGTPMALETEALLRPIMTALPGLEMMVHSASVPPYVLYQKVSDTISQLCTLRLSQVPPVLPIYQHNDMNACFLPLLDLMNSYIQNIDNHFASFPFTRKDRLFSLRLHHSFMERDSILIGVKAGKTRTENQLSDWMRGAVICSDFALEDVQSRRVTGATRHLLQSEELYDIMPARGVAVFRIQVDPTFIKAEQRLNIYNPADREDERPTEIMLHVKKNPQTLENEAPVAA